MDGSAVSAIRNTLSNGERTVKDMAHSSVLVTQLLCGATAGVAAKTAIAPIERVKMTFQLSSEKFSLTSCCRKLVDTVKTEGVLKLWRGHSANIARVAPYAALHYSIHDIAEGFLHNSSSPIVSDNKVLIQLISGSLAGGGATLVTYPLDVMRVRIAFGPSGLSFVQSWRAAFNHGGVWQGFVPTMLGVVPYSGTAWCAKEMFHRKYSAFAQRPVDTKERLFLNAMAGLVGQLVTYPLDVVRRRMQMVNILNNTVGGAAPKATAVATGSVVATAPLEKVIPFEFHNMRETFLRLYQTEGWRGLTKGYSLNVFKGPITLSISLTVYDVMRDWLKKDL